MLAWGVRPAFREVSVSDNLKYALARAQLRSADLAAALAVDPKTVDRWIAGRVPYPRHRYAIADFLQVAESDLWPEIAQRQRVIADEVQTVYPHRWAVPQAAWKQLFRSAAKEIGILTYSGLFLAEDAGLLRLIAERARAGVSVRILLGDPDSPEVAARGAEEGIGPEVMAGRTRNAITLYGRLRDVERVEVRLHGTVLYNSIYRADRDVLVNTHAYSTPAADAPVIHLRSNSDAGTAAVYLTSFERIWNQSQPLMDA